MKRLFLTATCLLSLAASAHADDTGTRAALQNRLDRLNGVLAGDICADPTAARTVLTEDITTPTPINGNTVTSLPRDTLVARLKQAVVMVVTESDGGSGFFVTPDTILTNAHVVANAKSTKVIVLGPGIGGVRSATLIARESGKGLQARDYALLRLSGTPATTTLALSATVTELEPVVAAGFPALMVENDIQFQRLMRGTATGLPDLILSQGTVMAVQNRSSRLPAIAHSAAISGGNSGGPLVDACGRVVGINTFIKVSVNQASNAGYAIAAEDILRFLKEHGISPTVHNESCR
ncbi:MAG: trypsin-like peptidase domain-containing protein [Rhodospirillaceae bacterium]|nr:trypsin-like peptidase domain-containing protein [Rhodospirillaceae bacterium]